MHIRRFRALRAATGLFLSVGLFAVLAGATTALAAGSWTAQTAPAAVPTGTDFKGVYFLDRSHGWLVGGQETAGYAAYTTNGGTSWLASTINGGSGSLTAVHFLDALNGYAVSDAGSIYNSTDGGVTWTVISETPTGVSYGDIHFGDSKHGCAVGLAGTASVIVCSQDGGNNWTQLDSTKVPNVDRLEGISFASSSVAYASGDQGLLKTVNANATLITDVTWTQMAEATPAPAQGIDFRRYADVHCVDTTHCWVVGEDVPRTGGETPFIASTTDGTNFVMQTNCTVAGLEAVSLPPADLLNGTIVGGVPEQTPPPQGGQICHTSDGGATAWTNQSSTAPDELMDVWMVDRCRAWAVSETAGIQAFNDPTGCLVVVSPSPSASTAALVTLPLAGHGPGGEGSSLLVALLSLLVGGGLLSLRRLTRS
jgi:photosystem II stability/assembly factor-like uncharacterized protein